MDAAAIDLPDGSRRRRCSAATGVMLVPDCDAAAREIARVLRPGGRAARRRLGRARPQRLDDRGGSCGARSSASPTAPRPMHPGPFRLADPERLRRAARARGARRHRHRGGRGHLARIRRSTSGGRSTLDTSRSLARARGAAHRSRARGASGRVPASASRSTSRADGSLAVPGVRTRRRSQSGPALADGTGPAGRLASTGSSCRARSRRARRRSAPSCSRDRGSGSPRPPRASRRARLRDELAARGAPRGR